MISPLEQIYARMVGEFIYLLQIDQLENIDELFNRLLK